MEFNYRKLKSKCFCNRKIEWHTPINELPIFNGFNVSVCNFDGIVYKISTESFKQYASLFILLEYNLMPDFTNERPGDSLAYLLRLIRAIRKNEQLKYMPKIIYLQYAEPKPKRNTFLKKVQRTNFLKIALDTVDNLIVLIATIAPYADCFELFTSFKKLKTAPVQTMLDSYSKDRFHDLYTNHFLIYTTTREACFLFNINPALGIIINNNKFFDRRERLGSTLDTKRLIELFEAKRMPYIVIQDGTAAEIRACMEMVKNSNLKQFTSILIVIMSHGAIGDIIYTQSGQFQVDEDIVAPLLANETLKTATKIVVTNACRGAYDPDYACFDEVEPLELTDTSAQPENLVKYYSTKRGCVSYRSITDGSFYIKNFCQQLDMPFQQRNLEDIANNVEVSLRNMNLFEHQATEFCTRPGTSHSFKVEYRSYENYIQQLEEFEKNVNATNAILKMIKIKYEIKN